VASEIVTRYAGAQTPCEEGVKKSTAVILIPPPVILSEALDRTVPGEAKNLGSSLRVSSAKDLRSWFGFK
jgi:hypothetical protein